MTDVKLRIPRLAAAVLVLGAACGDEEKGPTRDAGTKDDRGADGGHSQAGDDGGEGHDDDAGADEPDGGGNGAGGGDGGGGDDGDGGENAVDVSNARIQEVATAFCRTAFECNEAALLEYYDDEADCRADNESYWRDYVETFGEDCIDAQLDLYACYAMSTCEEIETACTAQIDVAEEICPTESGVGT